MRAVPGRVAHLTTVDSTLWLMLRDQLRAVRDRGGDAVGISGPGPWVRELEASGFRHRPLPSSTRRLNPWADLRAAIELWRVLRDERPEILHTHNPKPGVYGRIVGRLARVPIVVNTVHGLYATELDPWLRRAAVYFLEAIAARCSDAELVQNPEDLAAMERWHIVRSGQARLLGNGVDLTRFSPDLFTDEERAAVRAELGAGDEQILIGTVGRLVAEKGYEEFVAAAERLGDRYAFAAAGPDDPTKTDGLSPELRERAARANVKLLGFRHDLDRVYRAMDIFVLPSHREGLPRAAMEAASMGLPIVATDIRGCRQVVDNGRNGVLVPVGDVDSLTSAVRALGADGALRSRMGRASREIARDRFDEREVVSTVMATYDRLRSGRRRAVDVDVLQVVTRNERRGAEIFAVELGEALTRRGLCMRTVALAGGEGPNRLDVPILGDRAWDFRTFRALRREARRARLVVAHGSTTLPACAIALRGSGVPFVYRNIGDLTHWVHTWARRLRTRLFLERARAVVALGDEAAEQLTSVLGVAADRIAVIPTGVPRNRFPFVDDAMRSQARRRLGLPREPALTVSLGALSPEKDVGLAIGAVARCEGMHLLVAGDGPERTSLERRAQRDLPGRAHFVGAVEDTPTVLAAAELLILPSRTEGLPATAIEAGFSGLPVVATDVGFVRDVVVDGATGYVVPAGDGAALGRALEQALSNRVHLGEAARTHCIERFDLEVVALAWEQLVDRVS